MINFSSSIFVCIKIRLFSRSFCVLTFFMYSYGYFKNCLSKNRLHLYKVTSSLEMQKETLLVTLGNDAIYQKRMFVSEPVLFEVMGACLPQSMNGAI